MFGLSKERSSTQVGGAVREGIARDFVRGFLPVGFGLKSGLIFDAEKKKASPQCDAIIYKGVPLLDFTDTVIVEKEQVKAIFEIKSWIDITAIIGDKYKESKDRDHATGLFKAFKDRQRFLDPQAAKYILFAFELSAKKQDIELIDRLKQISNMYAIVSRKKIGKPWESDESYALDFDNSISELIEWLRNLS